MLSFPLRFYESMFHHSWNPADPSPQQKCKLLQLSVNSRTFSPKPFLDRAWPDIIPPHPRLPALSTVSWNSHSVISKYPYILSTMCALQSPSTFLCPNWNLALTRRFQIPWSFLTWKVTVSLQSSRAQEQVTDIQAFRPLFPCLSYNTLS